MGRSDEFLALRAARGDRRAFDAIYRRYGDSLYRFCLAMTGSPYDAQDALQNAMVKALRALPGEERQIRLKPWLYRVAHNESIEVMRRRRETEQLDPEQQSHGSVAETAELRERLRTLLTDLDLLSERQRAVLLMRELAGLDFADIGAVYETSAAAARQTLYEARLHLRELEEGRERRPVDVRKDLAAVAPLPAGGLLKLLRGLLGGGRDGGVGGGALAGVVSPAAQTVAVPVALKSAAAVALVVASATVADGGGLIDLHGRHGEVDAEVTAKPHRTAGTRAAAGEATPGATGGLSEDGRTQAALELGPSANSAPTSATPVSHSDPRGPGAPPADADHPPQGSPAEPAQEQLGAGPPGAGGGPGKPAQGQQGQPPQPPEAAERGLQAAPDRGGAQPPSTPGPPPSTGAPAEVPAGGKAPPEAPPPSPSHSPATGAPVAAGPPDSGGSPRQKPPGPPN